MYLERYALLYCGVRAVMQNSRSLKEAFDFLFIAPDIDECSIDPSPCDENANCTNSAGSYSCSCKQGFSGNGAVCEGMQENVIFYKCEQD